MAFGEVRNKMNLAARELQEIESKRSVRSFFVLPMFIPTTNKKDF